MQTLDTMARWQGLDVRTRSNVQSTLMCLSRPYLSVLAGRCFTAQGRPAFDVGRAASEGKLCIVSVSATEPEIASLFFKLLKGDFIRAVQQRGAGVHRLTGMIAEEFPLVVGSSGEDVETLATVRSRRCFVVAASQGLAVLDEKIGVRARKALLANFGSVIFLRGREEEVDQFAAVHLGVVEQVIIKPILPPTDEGNLLSSPLPQIKMRQQILACPPGTLGRLSPHQGFAALPGRNPQATPLWFVPWFETEPKPSTCTQIDPASVEHLRQLMHREGFKEQIESVLCVGATAISADEGERDRVLEQTITFFRSRACMIPQGLEKLRVSWLKALPGALWSQRKSHWTHLPFMLCELSFTEGFLLIRFAQEMARQLDAKVNSYDRGPYRPQCSDLSIPLPANQTLAPAASSNAHPEFGACLLNLDTAPMRAAPFLPYRFRVCILQPE